MSLGRRTARLGQTKFGHFRGGDCPTAHIRAPKIQDSPSDSASARLSNGPHLSSGNPGFPIRFCVRGYQIFSGMTFFEVSGIKSGNSKSGSGVPYCLARMVRNPRKWNFQGLSFLELDGSVIFDRPFLIAKSLFLASFKCLSVP